MIRAGKMKTTNVWGTFEEYHLYNHFGLWNRNYHDGKTSCRIQGLNLDSCPFFEKTSQKASCVGCLIFFLNNIILFRFICIDCNRGHWVVVRIPPWLSSWEELSSSSHPMFWLAIAPMSASFPLLQWIPFIVDWRLSTMLFSDDFVLFCACTCYALRSRQEQRVSDVLAPKMIWKTVLVFLPARPLLAMRNASAELSTFWKLQKKKEWWWFSWNTVERLLRCHSHVLGITHQSDTSNRYIQYCRVTSYTKSILHVLN